LRFLEVNAAAVAHYGYSRNEFLRLQIGDLGAVEDEPDVEGVDGETSGAARHRIKDGRVLDVELTSHELDFDGVAAVLVAVQDVTERNRLEGQLRHRAFHDPLTQLANRALFADRVDHALARLARDGRSLAVVVLDLDGFKTINDSLGHTAGDQLLVAAAQRLHNQLRPGDTAARLGGDEFAILLEDVEELSDATALAERLRDVFSAPFSIAGKQLLVTSSVGVAQNRPGDGPEELVRNADMAMYRAKADGKSRVRVYEPAMHDAALARLDLEAELRRALHHGQLVLHYQPTVRLADGELCGFEALLRWDHPERGLLPPAEFVPVAEETGLIVEMGRWVLREACAQVRTWQGAHPEVAMAVAVNVSPRQLLDPRLAEDVTTVLQATGLPAGSLTIEITESGILADRGGSVARLRELQALGVRVALDDFGTGYSSLSRLRELPIDLLKIDKGFIDGVAENTESTGLVHAILRMAETLALETIAEGVEEQAQADELRRLGAEYVQGYLFSRPLSPEQAEAYITERGDRGAVASSPPAVARTGREKGSR
jgi:diguanylate cyclase (GGDEF)-like protein/PAS domain S-box-containing protein